MLISRMVRILILLTLMLAAPAFAGMRVVDGDTLEIDGKIYRLNGIDAPEHGQKCGRWACGKEATEALKSILAGRTVRCQPLSKDGYGRIIATCYADGQDIGEMMVEAGIAWAFVKYSDAYEEAELNAKAKALGIWSGSYQPAWSYREAQWRSAQQTAPEGCPIKGNISRNGHIYHTPWSPWYERTRINTSKGEKWFCSEAEALAAGWRAPYWD